MNANDRPVMEPIRKKVRLYEEVVQQITSKIESGVLKPGDRLPTERDLVVQLGVSRTSVREALRALELMGMIESKVKEGTFVKKIGLDGALLRYAGAGSVDEKSITEMYAVRAQLETMSIRLASQNRTQKQLEAIGKTVDDMRAEIADGKRGQGSDHRFHMAVAEASGNNILLRILSMCADMVDSSIAASNRHANVNVLVSEHTEMYEAIKKKDAKMAERLMREHIGRAWDRAKFIAHQSKKKT